MELIVAKFGGTSIGNGQRIRKAAQSIVNAYMEGKKVVVVVSAINKTTDDLVAIADESIGKEVTENFAKELLSITTPLDNISSFALQKIMFKILLH